MAGEVEQQGALPQVLRAVIPNGNNSVVLKLDATSTADSLGWEIVSQYVYIADIPDHTRSLTDTREIARWVS